MIPTRCEPHDVYGCRSSVCATTGRVEVIGYIWWPNDVPCAYSYSLSAYDIENMRGEDGKIARREIQSWVDRNAGDFSEVADFRASIGGAEYGWMYGNED